MRDMGGLFGFDPEVDVCMAQCTEVSLGTPDYCSPECPCPAGEGDCDEDEDCAPGGVCAKNVGADFGFAPDVDVCVDACDPVLSGSFDYCSPGCLCTAGQGDCDENDDCAPGYLCVRDVGAAYGYDPEMDVCEAAPLDRVILGGNHTCSLHEGGGVRCWGFNRYGQLGYGHLDWIGDDEPLVSAGMVPIGGPARDLAAGESHTCAHLTTGEVRCWGNNDHGQLGYGHTNLIGDDETPAMAGDVPIP